MNVLIIKTGHTESFDLSNQKYGVVSLGDVLRTTVILHLFTNAKVTWWTSSEANPLIQTLSMVEKTVNHINELSNDQFDLIVNLERSLDICLSLKNLKAQKIVGFISPNQIETSWGIEDFTSWLHSDSIKKMNWSQKLFLLLGSQWIGQNYIVQTEDLNFKSPSSKIGLNWKVGIKWPSKTWPLNHWAELSEKLSGRFFYSWQEGVHHLNDYISWIQSCSTIVTHDSLGLHLAIALKKNIVLLVGPTSEAEIYLGKKAIVLSEKHNSLFECMPCYKEKCDQVVHCMSKIEVKDVLRAIEFFERIKDGQLTT